MDEYQTVKREIHVEYLEHHSRFIASVKPIVSEEEVFAWITFSKSRYPDTSHYVYAYPIRDDRVSRYFDDGEPKVQQEFLCSMCF